MNLPPSLEEIIAGEAEVVKGLVWNLMLSREPAETVVRILQDTFGRTVSASTVRTWRRTNCDERFKHLRESAPPVGGADE